MHDIDTRLEDRLRTILHDEARELPFDIPVARLQRRLDERRVAVRWRMAGLAVAASAAVAVGVGVAVVSLTRPDDAPAATPSPSTSFPVVVVSPSPSPSAEATPSPTLAPCSPLTGPDVDPGLILTAADGSYRDGGIVDSRDVRAPGASPTPGPWVPIERMPVSTSLDFVLRSPAYCASRWRVEMDGSGDILSGIDSTSSAVLATSATVSRELAFSIPESSDWTIRVETEWWSDGGERVVEVRYFRVLAGEPIPSATPEPTPVAQPHPDPTVPCRPEDLTARGAPDVSLRRGGAFVAKGQRGTESWGTSVTDSAEVAPETSILVGSADSLILTIDGDVCAISWSVSYGEVPADRLGHTAIGDLVDPQRNPDRDPAFARENRFPLAPLPPGDWWIKADLSYVHGGALMYWRITVPSRFIAPVATFAAGDASVAGEGQCGGSFVMADGSAGFDECGPVFTPVAIQRALHVTAGSRVRVTVDEWQVARADGGIVSSAIAVPATDGGLTFQDLAVRVADGSASFTAPLAPGDWHVRIQISGTRPDGSRFEQGFLIRLIVDG